jgi:hypothetical protein
MPLQGFSEIPGCVAPKHIAQPWTEGGLSVSSRRRRRRRWRRGTLWFFLIRRRAAFGKAGLVISALYRSASRFGPDTVRRVRLERKFATFDRQIGGHGGRWSNAPSQKGDKCREKDQYV